MISKMICKKHDVKMKKIDLRFTDCPYKSQYKFAYTCSECSKEEKERIINESKNR